MLIYNHQHNLNFLENNNLLLTYQVAKCNAFRRPEWHCPLTSNTYIIKAHNYITLNENQHDKCNSLLVVSKNSHLLLKTIISTVLLEIFLQNTNYINLE